MYDHENGDIGCTVSVFQTNNNPPETIYKEVAEYVLSDFKGSPRFDYYISFTNASGVNTRHMTFSEFIIRAGMNEAVVRLTQDYLNRNFVDRHCSKL
jgi:hypothetical protein